MCALITGDVIQEVKMLPDVFVSCMRTAESYLSGKKQCVFVCDEEI